MLNPTILKKLKELNIRTITEAVNVAQQDENLLNITIRVEPPYFFVKTSLSKERLKKEIFKSGVIGYIAINGKGYLIVYIKNQDNQNRLMTEYKDKVYDSLFIDLYQHVEIRHKKKPEKNTVTPTIDTFATSSIFDDLQELSNELPNVYYPQEHPYIYLYENALMKECFSSSDFFKFFSALTLIAEKSNIIIQQHNTCHIRPEDIMAIIPQSFKRATKTLKTPVAEQPEKRKYQKTYIKFLDFACNSGMVDNYTILDSGYIQIVFNINIKNYFSEPPYIKIPYELVGEITKYNYKFLMYFIKREFHNNPQYPCNINIKLKELLKITGITTHDTLEVAADRLNKYLDILKKYHAIRNDDIYVTPEDIHNNKPLRFRLFHFRFFINELMSLEIEESEEMEEPTPEEPNPKAKKFIPSEAFLRANAEIDARKI